MDLTVAVKLLSSQFLSKKIQGLNEISEILSEVRLYTASVHNNNDQCINDRRTTEDVFA